MIGVNQIFTKESANTLVPLIIKITKHYRDAIVKLSNPPDGVGGIATKQEEEKVNALVDEWTSKMTKLGGRTGGLWLVDFDSGDGYFCWKYPEPEILFWHEYSASFSGRKAI